MLYCSLNSVTFRGDEFEIREAQCLHLAVRYENENLELYVDGEIIQRFETGAFGNPFKTYKWNIGFSDPLLQNGFQSGLEEIRLWNAAIDPYYISTHRSAPLTQSPLDPINFYIPLIEGQGTSVSDPFTYSTTGLFPSALGHNSVHDPVWASEGCVEDFRNSFSPARLGQGILTCVPTTNNLICNGNFEQYDLTLATLLNVPTALRNEPFTPDAQGYTDIPNWTGSPTANTPWHPDTLSASCNIYPFINYSMSGTFSYFSSLVGWNWPVQNDGAVVIWHAYDTVNAVFHNPDNYLETTLSQTLLTNRLYRLEFFSQNPIYSFAGPHNPAGLCIQLIDTLGNVSLLDTVDIFGAAATPYNGWAKHSIDFTPGITGVTKLRIVPTKPTQGLLTNWPIDLVHKPITSIAGITLMNFRFKM